MIEISTSLWLLLVLKAMLIPDNNSEFSDWDAVVVLFFGTPVFWLVLWVKGWPLTLGG